MNFSAFQNVMTPADTPILSRRTFLYLCGLAWVGYRATSLDQAMLAGPLNTCSGDQPQPAAPYTFDSFVVSPRNQAAFEAVVAVARKPFFTYNPLFIHGAAGLGKTHLLLALGEYLSVSNPHLQVLYLPATWFAYLVDKAAVGASAARRFCERFRQADVILIDNLHHFTDESACDFVPPDIPHCINGTVGQNVLLELFNEMYGAASKLFVFTSVCAPDLIPGLSRHLAQRCQWGLVEKIERSATGHPF